MLSVENSLPCLHTLERNNNNTIAVIFCVLCQLSWCVTAGALERSNVGSWKGWPAQLCPFLLKETASFPLMLDSQKEFFRHSSGKQSGTTWKQFQNQELKNLRTSLVNDHRRSVFNDLSLNKIANHKIPWPCVISTC